MRNLAFLILIISLSVTAFSQNPKSNFEKTSKPETAKAKVGDEKEEFRKAINQVEPEKRVNALLKFVETFPNTEQKDRALGLIVSGRAEIADAKLLANETEEGVELFKLAVKEAPKPIEEKLFTGVVLQIPNNLFWRGQRLAAYEVAEMIEEKASKEPKQLLALSTFYIGIEYASGAIRLAKKALELEPNSRVGYQTLGLAYRLGFQLDNSAEAYAKALEFDPSSTTSIRNLAEMKRATGKTGEAITLYQSILEKDPNDNNARTGLILSMFDAGKVVEAEIQMNKSLEDTPNNLLLLVGAAYWYAANGDGSKAVELSQKALTIEPRYTWGYIAMARGLMKQNDPLAAERVLLAARQYGNFPTLQYEIASARLAAGFYKDAVDEISQSFTLENGAVVTKLGGRIEAEAESFTKLLSLERQAGIFQPLSADDPENAEKLKKLLKFSKKLEKPETDESEIISSAEEFIEGSDKMKTHRQIFVAERLLEKKKALPKVLEITKDAVKGVDAALEVKTSSSAVLADQLYEPRRIANSRGEAVIVPEIPRQMLANIIRGRIEEISGWALHSQEKEDEAIVRMKRAISVMPKDSAFLRSSMWRMGTILEAKGESKDALDYYIKGYSAEENDEVKKIVIEGLYKKLNGSLEGLEEKLASTMVETNKNAVFAKKTESVAKKPEPQEKKEEKEDTNKLNLSKIPDIVPIARNSVKTQPKPTPEEIKTELTTEIKPEPTPAPETTLGDEKIEDEIIEDKPVETNEATSLESVETEKLTVDTSIEPKKPETENIVDESEEGKKEDTLPTDSTNDVSTEIKTANKTDNILDNSLVKAKTEESKNEIRSDDSLIDTDETANSVENNADPNEAKTIAEEVKNETPIDNKVENTEANKIETNIEPLTVKPENATEIKNQNSTETIKSDSNESQNSAKPKSKIFNKPIVVIEDKLSNTKVEQTPNIMPFEKKVVEPIKEESKADVPAEKSVLENKKAIDPENDLIVDETKVESSNSEIILESEKTTPTESAEKEPGINETPSDKEVQEVSENTLNNAGATRPRFVSNENVKNVNGEISPCKIVLSQDVVSIINNGGNLGLLVGVENGQERNEIKAVSSSPADVEVMYEPEIGAVAGRAFFVISSISTNQGEYKVTLDTPCGKKEILVKVR